MARMRTMILTMLILAMLVLPAAAREYTEADFAGKTLDEIVADFRAEYGLTEEDFALSYENTVTGERYGFQEHHFMVAASTFKLPLNLYITSRNWQVISPRI